MSDKHYSDVGKERAEWIASKIPGSVVETFDYGSSYGVKVSDRKAFYVVRTFRPERDGQTGYQLMTQDRAQWIVDEYGPAETHCETKG